jgi:SpoVK/Ycf46/Vps4 family AAA+-type ATPase
VLPHALEKDAVVLDVPLPSREEIGMLLALLLRSQGIEVPPERFEQFVTASLGLTEKEIKRAFARVLLDGERFGESDVRRLLEEKEALLRRSRFLEFVRPDVRMEDVGGLENLKEWLKQRRLAFTERARAFGLPPPKGLFLLGVQGCGKSLAAKAVAELWRVPLVRLDMGALFEGRADEGLRDTIRVAESLAPAVLWIDEIEKAFAGTGDEAARVFGAFLTWMQEKTLPVFVVGTANEVRALPPELLRKGRFDEIFFVDLPTPHERLQILDIHVRRAGRDPERFDLLALAEETERHSGAELEQLVVAALFRAFAAGRELTQEDLSRVARESVPLAVTMDDRLKELREWARPRARPASVDTRRMSWFTEWDE